MEWDHPVSAELREAQQREISARYGVANSEPGPKPSSSDITAFFVAFLGATTERDGTRARRPVGCGGLRRLAETMGEIKRMYVPPVHRGNGYSRHILRALEDHARSLGWTRLMLETGDRQHEAIGLYRRSGYGRIPNFGPYAADPHSLCFEKVLA